VFTAALAVFLTDVLINEAPPCGLVALPSGQQKLGDTTSTGSLWSRFIQTKSRVRDSTLGDPCHFNGKRSEETFRARKGVRLGRKSAAWGKKKMYRHVSTDFACDKILEEIDGFDDY
jgi:hypothetical protein